MSDTLAEQRAEVGLLLSTVQLRRAMGTWTNPGSMAAINIALFSQLTDKIPDCVSLALGQWVNEIQDSMPLAMLNGEEWRDGLPFILGTAGKDAEHRAAILDWLFGVVLPYRQPVADDWGIGEEWRRICGDRDVDAAKAVRSLFLGRAEREREERKRKELVYNVAALADSIIRAVSGAPLPWCPAASAAYKASKLTTWPVGTNDEDEYWQAINPPALLTGLVAAQAKDGQQ